MAPIVHCVRHGQGFHNLGAGHYSLPDPRLTPKGEDQCESLRNSFHMNQSSIALVAASPLCRTLHTAILVFGPALLLDSKCPPRVLALPDAQETSDDPCDTGSNPDLLRSVVVENQWPVDLSLVKEGWNVKTLENRYSPHSDAIKARARDVRVFLRQKLRELNANGNADAQVVLVTHGGFLHYFTDDWEDAYQYPGTGWHNCETRSYCFEDGLIGADGEEARLTETTESRQKRGKTGPMYGRDKQAELFQVAMERWESQGLQRPDTFGMSQDI